MDREAVAEQIEDFMEDWFDARAESLPAGARLEDEPCTFQHAAPDDAPDAIEVCFALGRRRREGDPEVTALADRALAALRKRRPALAEVPVRVTFCPYD